MFVLQASLISIIIFLILSPEISDCKIVDFNSDNPLFHPFVQAIRNYRSKDYLIKLLKRNLEQKLRKNRKLPEDRLDAEDRENQKVEKPKCGCNCRCNERSFEKRCEHCEHCPNRENAENPERGNFKNFICESEGSFAKPNSCQEFYICFHNETDPVEVTCPKGFAFDSEERKCTREAARECMKKQMSIYKI